MRKPAPSSPSGVPAFGYVSLPADRPADEVERRRLKLDVACRRLNLRLVDVVSEPEPEPVEGEARPGLTSTLDRIDAGEADCLIVNDLEDLSRSVAPFATVLDRLERQGTRLVALNVGLDTATETGRLATARRAPGGEAAPAEVEAPAEEAAPAEEGGADAQMAAEAEAVAEAEAAAEAEAVLEAALEAEAGLQAEAALEAEATRAEPEPGFAEPEAAEAAAGPAAPPAEPPPQLAEPAAATAVRALGYASVPADAADTSELDAQRAAIERWCERGQVDLVEVVCEREPRNGKALDRGGLSFLIERIAAGGASCIVVSGLERLSRSVAELGTIVRWLERNDVRLVAMDLDLDTARPGGRTTLRALASVAGWEHERLSDRTRKGLEAARERRRAASSSTPDWAAVRKRIATMRADGMTLQAIADRLNEEGVPTMRGGAKWRKSSVQTAAGYRRRAKSTLPEVGSE